MVEHFKTKALFSESNVPPGGTCLSSFVAVTNGRSILVGKMAHPEIWTDRFLVGPKFATKIANSGKYLLPARHLHWYESPSDAALSCMREQVRLKVSKGGISFVEVQSHVSGDVNNTEEPPHWDLCFLYKMQVPTKDAKSIAKPEWFSELRFVPMDGLKAEDFARGHGDVLQAAGMIGGGRKKR
jgi:ADP-ribose pyrophosphatase YjhB (NUDIX family)